MSWFSRLLGRLLPEDDSDQCGYYFLSLPEGHVFERGCSLHDWEFHQAHLGKGEKSLAEVDWDLFYRWVLLAKAAGTPEERCKLAQDICTYWPYARRFGGLLWDGKDD